MRRSIVALGLIVLALLCVAKTGSASAQAVESTRIPIPAGCDGVHIGCEIFNGDSQNTARSTRPLVQESDSDVAHANLPQKVIGELGKHQPIVAALILIGGLWVSWKLRPERPARR